MSVQEIVNQIDAGKRVEIESAQNIFFTGLNNVNVARLPENIFVSNILPALKRELSEENTNQVMKYWMSVAGGYLADIDVFDPMTGKVLFRLPSIMDSSGINHEKNGNNLHDIVIKAELLGNNMGVLKDRYLMENFYRKDFDDASGINLERKAQFDAIIARYDSSYATAKVVVANPEDDFDYD
jgi:hypothetical protein